MTIEMKCSCGKKQTSITLAMGEGWSWRHDDGIFYDVLCPACIERVGVSMRERMLEEIRKIIESPGWNDTKFQKIVELMDDLPRKTW